MVSWNTAVQTTLYINIKIVCILIFNPNGRYISGQRGKENNEHLVHNNHCCSRSCAYIHHHRRYTGFAGRQGAGRAAPRPAPRRAPDRATTHGGQGAGRGIRLPTPDHVLHDQHAQYMQLLLNMLPAASHI